MKAFNWLKKEKDLTVLVSGGIDSIAASHWLKFRFRRNISVIHFNHRVQPANELMESQVIAFCEAYNMPLTVIHRTDTQSDLSEAHMRQWRLNELQKIGGDKKYVTGHHIGDVVECYVANFITGNPEYVPMSERTDFGNFEILHPFLLTTKEDMLKYIRQNGADRFVVEDPTNKKNCYRRNSIRNQIIPLINQWTNLETIVKHKFYSKSPRCVVYRDDSRVEIIDHDNKDE